MRMLAEALHVEHSEWFTRTGHCGGCGQPGDWCQCHEKAPCGCRELHVMGAGIGRDPAEMFADTTPVEIEQEGLFE